MSNIDYVHAFKKLTSAESPGAKFASYELRQMLGGNAEKLLTKAKGIDDGN